MLHRERSGGRKFTAGVSAAALTVALSAAVVPAAFAQDPDPISVDIDFPAQIIQGAPEASSNDVDNHGIPVPGNYQYPGTGKVTVNLDEPYDLVGNTFAGRVTVEGDGLGDAWGAADMADDNRYDFWFRFRDYDNNQGGQYKGTDFAQDGENRVVMASPFQGLSIVPAGAFLENADINLLSNLDWTGPITVTIEFLEVQLQGGTDYQVLKILGSDTFQSEIVSAINVDPQPADQVVTEGEDAIFTTGATGVPEAPFDELGDIAVQWEASTDGGATWTEVADGTGNELTIAGAELNQTGTQFRAQFSAADGPFTATSDVATLTVVAEEEAPADEPESPVQDDDESATPVPMEPSYAG